MGLLKNNYILVYQHIVPDGTVPKGLNIGRIQKHPQMKSHQGRYISVISPFLKNKTILSLIIYGVFQQTLINH
jgi:hypothetical protein